MSELIQNDIPYILGTLEQGMAIHRRLRERIDFTQESKRHAIYLLQGGCITNTILACNHYSQGYQNHVMQAIRFIFESRELAAFFVDIPEGDRRLCAWFEGKIVRPPNKAKRTQKNLKPIGMPSNDPKEFEEWMRKAVSRYDMASKLLYAAYSKGHHPTIDAVRFNMERNTYEFVYDCSPLRMRPLVNMDLEGSLLVPTLQTLWNSAKINLLNQEEFLLLRELIRQTEIRSRGSSSLKPLLAVTRT